MKAIFQNEEIGDPAYDGLTFGGYALTTPLLKADYPGLRAIRLEDGTVILAEDLPDSYTIPPGGGGGGGDHVDSDHADAFSPLAHTHAAHADSDHDDRFSLLAHAHAGVYALVEHDSTHDDRFSLLAHTHAAHADSDHDDRFALIAQGVPAGGATGEVLAKSSGTNYATVWQAASAPAPQPLDWLTDVNTAGQASTNVLTYNGSSWVPAAIPAHADTDHDDRFSLLAHTHSGPLGMVDYKTGAAQTGIGSVTDLTGLTSTFTAVAGRRYKLSALVRTTHVTTAGVQQCTITDGANNGVVMSQCNVAVSAQFTHTPFVVVTPGAGSVTYKVRMAATAGTVSTAHSVASPALFIVEDIG